MCGSSIKEYLVTCSSVDHYIGCLVLIPLCLSYLSAAHYSAVDVCIVFRRCCPVENELRFGVPLPPSLSFIGRLPTVSYVEDFVNLLTQGNINRKIREFLNEHYVSPYAKGTFGILKRVAYKSPVRSRDNIFGALGFPNFWAMLLHMIVLKYYWCESFKLLRPNVRSLASS